MTILRPLFLLALAALLALPAYAGADAGSGDTTVPDKSLFASMSANGEDGSPLLALALAGECSFSPVPVCKVKLSDTRIDTPLFSGSATGTATIELAPEKLLLRGLDLVMDKAALRLDEGREQTVNLRLRGSGEYAPASGALELSDLTLTTDRGLTLGGRLVYAPDAFSARLAVNLAQPAKLAALLGPALPEVVRANLPAGSVVLDLAATGDGDSFGPLGVNLLTTATLKKGVTLGKDGFTLAPLSLKARLRTDQPEHVLAASVFLPGGMLQVNADATSGDADGPVVNKITLRGKGLDLARLAPLAQQVSGLPVADWGALGALDLACDADILEDGLTADTRLSVRGAGYMSPMADYMAQGLDADLRLKTRLRSASNHRLVSARLTVPAGELLFGSAYLNMTGHPLKLSANAEQTAPLRFRGLKADVDWAGYGKVTTTGDLVAEGSPEAWKYKADLEAVELGLGRWFDTLADALALKNFQGEHGLEGEGALDLHLVADGKTSDVTGRLYVADASLTSADNAVEVRGASLYLPLSYRLVGPYLPISPQFVAEDGWGELHADLVRAPFVEMESSTTRLALIPNRFFIRDPLLLSVLGGRVRLSGLQVDQPFSRRFTAKLGVQLSDLDLAKVTKGAFPLEGKLGGNLGTVTMTQKAVEVPGSIHGEFFGGTVLVDRPFAENPLTAHRKLGLSVTVRELDLERISTAMDVGRVTGKMDLDMHDFVVAYGEPVGMLLRAETSGSGDFDKTVSLKAVNSLSVIGTGSGLGDVGVGMFASFFEEFSYARIGFQCTLNNDIFRVRGLVRDGGVEYLIKKPFFTGINVVNSNPNNYISFKDMLERVQRVLGEKKG